MYERMRKRCEIAGQRISLGANHERDFEYRRGSQPIRGHISIRGADLATRVGIMSYTAAFFFFFCISRLIAEFRERTTVFCTEFIHGHRTKPRVSAIF